VLGAEVDGGRTRLGEGGAVRRREHPQQVLGVGGEPAGQLGVVLPNRLDGCGVLGGGRQDDAGRGVRSGGGAHDASSAASSPGLGTDNLLRLGP
jgi:hypothetical protein